MVMGWAGLLWFIGSWVRALGGGWGWLRWAGLGWARLVCGFVGSWVALGFVWGSFLQKSVGGTRAKWEIVYNRRTGNSMKNGEILGGGLGWAGLGGWAGSWVRGFVGRSRVRVGELPESDERRVLV